MPVQLNTQFCRSTIVFDAIEYKNDKKMPLVEAQFREMFRPKEFWYLPETEFSPTAPGAADEFIARLEKKQSAYELSNTGYKINLFFYLNLENTDLEKAERLKNFIQRTALLLTVPTLELRSYIVASKYKQNTEMAMHNLESLMDLFVGVQEMHSPQLMLLEAMPLAKIDGSLRATVRVANIFSRNGVLYDYLQKKTSQKTLWNWTLSEFDEEEFQGITEKLERIENSLNDRIPFPTGELQNNLRAAQKSEEQKNIGLCALNAEKFPVPAAAIKRGLIFGGKAAEETAEKFAVAVKETYRCNLEKRCFPEYTHEELFTLCREMTNNIPMSHWKNIPENLRSGLGEYRMKLELPSVSLHPAISLAALREQLAEQINKLHKEVRTYYPQYITELIAKRFHEFLESDEVRNEEQELKDSASDLQLRIEENKGIREGTEYLANIMRISNETVSLYYHSYYEKSQYILISDKINENWENKYASFLPSVLNGERDVYNYMDLQQYEFQTLTLITFNREKLEQSKRMMFKLGGVI